VKASVLCTLLNEPVNNIVEENVVHSLIRSPSYFRL
jgi:hypothetical protein